MRNLKKEVHPRPSATPHYDFIIPWNQCSFPEVLLFRNNASPPKGGEAPMESTPLLFLDVQRAAAGLLSNSSCWQKISSYLELPFSTHVQACSSIHPSWQESQNLLPEASWVTKNVQILAVAEHQYLGAECLLPRSRQYLRATKKSIARFFVAETDRSWSSLLAMTRSKTIIKLKQTSWKVNLGQVSGQTLRPFPRTDKHNLNLKID